VNGRGPLPRLHGRLLHLLLLCAGVAVVLAVSRLDTKDGELQPAAAVSVAESLNSVESRGAETLYARSSIVGSEAAASEPDPLVRQEASEEEGGGAIEAVAQGPAFFMYVVEEGDDLSAIAAKFSLNPQTVVDNNVELDRDDYSDTGRQIIMLSTDGMLHTMKFEEDLDFVAGLYGVSRDAIVNFAPNGLSGPDDVSVGRVLVVPGGVRPTPVIQIDEPEDPDSSAPETDDATAEADEPDEAADAPADAGQADNPDTSDEPPPPPPAEEEEPPPADDGGSVGGWVWPVSGCGITRGVGGGHEGIDIDLFCNGGATVVAAASGTVTFAGWDGGYGLSVIIDHGNGLFSRYAHLSSTSVGAGESVSAGQVIGVSGTTGNSTGEHLHFEIRSGSVYGTVLDPLAYLP
jgi:murein DD-endopeptidase MepM/ murein hydrolase activator NlpD